MVGLGGTSRLFLAAPRGIPKLDLPAEQEVNRHRGHHEWRSKALQSLKHGPEVQRRPLAGAAALTTVRSARFLVLRSWSSLRRWSRVRVASAAYGFADSIRPSKW